MNIYREKIGNRIKELEDRVQTKDEGIIGGMQPLMALGCFYDLNVNNDSICRRCKRYYKTCKTYLQSYENKEKKLTKHMRELNELNLNLRIKSK
jgi:hypothetical protein